MMIFICCLMIFAGLAIADPEEKIIYDGDGRQDYYNSAAQYQAMIRSSIVVLMRASKLSCSGDVCTPDTKTFGSSMGLCTSERFYSQPSAGFCSGTLVGPDRVATAGHCITTQAECDRTLFVFNYYYTSSTTLATISKSKDVYQCRRFFSELSTSRSDWAIVQLDRAVHSSHSPAKTIGSRTALSVNDQLALIGFPSGIPAKVDATVYVTRASDSWGFYTVMDAYAGNSGSGVFRRSDMVMVGIDVRGNTDFKTSGGCVVSNQVSSTSYPSYGVEQSSHVYNLISQAPNCTTNSECPDSVTCATDGSYGFCEVESNVCSSLCTESRNNCCFAGSSQYGACTTCTGTDCLDNSADSCITCGEGHEIKVVYTNCAGYCVPKGTSNLKPSQDICPGQYPLPNCNVSACGGINPFVNITTPTGTSDAFQVFPSVLSLVFIAIVGFFTW